MYSTFTVDWATMLSRWQLDDKNFHSRNGRSWLLLFFFFTSFAGYQSFKKNYIEEAGVLVASMAKALDCSFEDSEF